jgi:hypothetical protein
MKMNKHNDNFEKGADDMDTANDALDDGKYLKAGAYAVKGIALPIAGVVKDPIGFLRELIS